MSQLLRLSVALLILSSAAASRAEEPLSRIAFGSCIKQDLPVPIFKTLGEQKPQLMLFLGDNIYADTEDMDVMRAKYAKLASNIEFTKVCDSCPVLATWDDHDFGVNDGGADYPKRGESQQAFLDFWKISRDSPMRSQAGIYHARSFGPAMRRVQVIMLDTRYFRSPLKKGERRVGGPYYPDNAPAKTMLGEVQWAWLKQQLQEPAKLRLIVSSIQFAATCAGQESWSNLPAERSRMLHLISETDASGVLFLSGDRHWSELSVITEDVPYPIYDLTSSSFNQIHARGTPTENLNRAIDKTYHRENFGLIEVDWAEEDPAIQLSIIDMQGEVVIAKTLRLSGLFN